MDKLFEGDYIDMCERLESVRREMEKDLYHFGEDTKKLSSAAFQYIRAIFSYMKKTYRPELCTVPVMLKELYRIWTTGEYSYIQDEEEIIWKDRLFERLKEPYGYEEMRYAARLLRHYCLSDEASYIDQSGRNDIEDICMRIELLGYSGVQKKKWKTMEKKEGADIFMRELRSHMDTYMVGQEVLKKKLCTVLYQWYFHDVRTTFLMIGPSGSGKNHMIETLRSFPGLGYPVVSYDCSALTPNGFQGDSVKDLFRKIKIYLGASANFLGASALTNSHANSGKCIVYLDEVDKIINFNHDSRGESVNAIVQQQLLSALAGTETIDGVDTGKLLFILGGAFPRIDELCKEKSPVGFRTRSEYRIDEKESLRDQIRSIGGEAEFVGRIEEIVRMSRLTRSDLKAILLDKKIGVYNKKKEIYQVSGFELEMDEDTVDAVLDMIESEDLGARSVKNIMNELADSQYFFDMMVGGYDKMRIHKGMLRGEPPIYMRKGEYTDGKGHTYFTAV